MIFQLVGLDQDFLKLRTVIYLFSLNLPVLVGPQLLLEQVQTDQEFQLLGH